MLEQPALLLRPWGPVAGGERTRPIEDAATQTPLGLARDRPSQLPPILGWLARPVLAVYETEDESLLSTVARRWGMADRWQVGDADARLVGSVHWMGRNQAARIHVLDRRGELVAAGSGTEPRLITSDGVELGNITLAPEGVRLTFAGGPLCDPFVRMLLLAAALTLP
jgi:hypothetical protein